MTDDNGLDARIAAIERSLRRWQILTAILVACLAAAAWHTHTTANRVLPIPAKPDPGTYLVSDYIKTHLLEIVDDKGKAVISMMPAIGGGSIMVESATPHDHSVMIMASSYGADVTVSSQHKPRQFGELKIMDGKPYLQLHEEGNLKNFYQAPLYGPDGNISRPENFLSTEPTTH